MGKDTLWGPLTDEERAELAKIRIEWKAETPEEMRARIEARLNDPKFIERQRAFSTKRRRRCSCGCRCCG